MVRRQAIGAPAAAVVIVAIISASAVAIFWIGVSSRAEGTPTTVTVTVTETSSPTGALSTTTQQSSSQPGANQVSVTGVTAPAADFATSGKTTAFTCDLLPGQGAYLEVTNTGPNSATLTGMTITWAGANNAFTPPPAGCQVGSAGSNTAMIYVNLPDPATLTVGAVGGQTFHGALDLTNGTEVPFSGTFLLG